MSSPPGELSETKRSPFAPGAAARACWSFSEIAPADLAFEGQDRNAEARLDGLAKRRRRAVIRRERSEKREGGRRKWEGRTDQCLSTAMTHHYNASEAGRVNALPA